MDPIPLSVTASGVHLEDALNAEGVLEAGDIYLVQLDTEQPEGEGANEIPEVQYARMAEVPPGGGLPHRSAGYLLEPGVVWRIEANDLDAESEKIYIWAATTPVRVLVGMSK